MNTRLSTALILMLFVNALVFTGCDKIKGWREKQELIKEQKKEIEKTNAYEAKVKIELSKPKLENPVLNLNFGDSEAEVNRKLRLAYKAKQIKYFDGSYYEEITYKSISNNISKMDGKICGRFNNEKLAEIDLVYEWNRDSNTLTNSIPRYPYILDYYMHLDKFRGAPYLFSKADIFDFRMMKNNVEIQIYKSSNDPGEISSVIVQFSDKATDM